MTSNTANTLLRASPYFWMGLIVVVSGLAVFNLATGSLGDRWLSIIALIGAPFFAPFVVRDLQARRLGIDWWTAAPGRRHSAPGRRQGWGGRRVSAAVDAVAAVLAMALAVWSLLAGEDAMVVVLLLAVALGAGYLAVYERALARLQTTHGV